MSLPKDPFMLYSAINMKLRDQFSSLQELCDSEGINIEELKSKLASAGFEYMPSINQFR